MQKMAREIAKKIKEEQENDERREHESHVRQTSGQGLTKGRGPTQEDVEVVVDAPPAYAI
jgi:hypothetical protein